MLDVVVARYKEDISWTSQINHNIIIYNKYYHNEENPLNNVGREANTYLYHIINNYNNLSDYTAFLQGSPIDHCKDIIDLLNSFNSTEHPIYFGKNVSEPMNSLSYPQCPNGLPIYYFISLLFNNAHKINKCEFNAGSQFIIPKANILNREIQFYKILYKLCSFGVDDLEPYLYERLWKYIFDPNFITSDKIKLLY